MVGGRGVGVEASPNVGDGIGRGVLAGGGVAVFVGVEVEVGVAVGVGVRVAVGVLVGVGVFVGVGVCVMRGISVSLLGCMAMATPPRRGRSIPTLAARRAAIPPAAAIRAVRRLAVIFSDWVSSGIAFPNLQRDAILKV